MTTSVMPFGKTWKELSNSALFKHKLFLRALMFSPSYQLAHLLRTGRKDLVDQRFFLFSLLFQPTTCRIVCKLSILHATLFERKNHRDISAVRSFNGSPCPLQPSPYASCCQTPTHRASLLCRRGVAVGRTRREQSLCCYQDEGP